MFVLHMFFSAGYFRGAGRLRRLPLLAELERLRANEPQPPEYSRHGEDEC